MEEVDSSTKKGASREGTPSQIPPSTKGIAANQLALLPTDVPISPSSKHGMKRIKNGPVTVDKSGKTSVANKKPDVCLEGTKGGRA